MSFRVNPTSGSNSDSDPQPVNVEQEALKKQASIWLHKAEQKIKTIVAALGDPKAMEAKLGIPHSNTAPREIKYATDLPSDPQLEGKPIFKLPPVVIEAGEKPKNERPFFQLSPVVLDLDLKNKPKKVEKD
jgi:hypothetical protein